MNEQKISPFEETDRYEREERDKIRLASLNGDGENCEAANGVKFVEIHFSSVDAAKTTKTVLACCHDGHSLSPTEGGRGGLGELVKH